ncbi:MAG: hypothetical protein JSV91_02535 [Phycisphaerales bacterium]|nr:MAG: hypothetical protein JSV91_02535 [Phycisphaerales bacterium]
MSISRNKSERRLRPIAIIAGGLFIASLLSTPARAECPEDINQDGVVDILDLFELLVAWGECPDPDDCPADLEGDGLVGRRDLAILLAAWGDCYRPDYGTIAHSVAAIDNSYCQEPGYFEGGLTHHTFDLMATTTNPENAWTTSWAHSVLTDERVYFFQHYSQYGNGAPPDSYLFDYFPSLEFDSYWCHPTVIGPGEAGTGEGMLDIEPWIEHDHELLTTWYYKPPFEQAEGIPHTIARITLRTMDPGEPYVAILPEGMAGAAPLAGTFIGDTTHRTGGPDLIDWAYDIIAGQVAVDEDVDDGETVLLNPGGGTDDPTLEPLVEFTNESGTNDAWIVITESHDDLHPDADRYYEVLDISLVSSTLLGDGGFFMQVMIPFSAADLNGGDPMDIDLAYYDAAEERWFLSVRGNTADSPGHDGPVGDRFAVVDTTVPDLSDELGDFGVYWNPDTQTGFAWANVDHSATFAAGFANCRGADVNFSGEVNIDDIFDILSAWGDCDECPEDVNDDGTVNIDDIFDALYVWGPCP